MPAFDCFSADICIQKKDQALKPLMFKLNLRQFLIKPFDILAFFYGTIRPTLVQNIGQRVKHSFSPCMYHGNVNTILCGDISDSFLTT